MHLAFHPLIQHEYVGILKTATLSKMRVLQCTRLYKCYHNWQYARSIRAHAHSFFWQVSVRFSCSSVTAFDPSSTRLAVMTRRALSRCWCTASVPAGGADLNSISFSAPQNWFLRRLWEVHDLCATRQHTNSRLKSRFAHWTNA